jgi:deazaflavin-dependent oxidoreductase (nitroreductase family)
MAPRLDYLALADRSWPLLRRLMAVHGLIYRATGGRLGGWLPGLPQILVLEHKGRKTGTVRYAPLLYARDGERLVIVASKGGYPKHPAWYLNLQANPQAAVHLGGRRIPVRAYTAKGEERERLWQLALTVYPTYARYQERTDREIPVVVLEPIGT